MADETPNNASLPPKLDLRKNGIVKPPEQAAVPPAPAAPAFQLASQPRMAPLPSMSAPPAPVSAPSAQPPSPPAPFSFPRPSPAPYGTVPVSLKKPVITSVRPAIPTSMAQAETAAPAAGMESKKKTSRIPLETAMVPGATGETQTVRTIRIKPSPTTEAAAASADSAPVGIPSAPVMGGTGDPKRKTSRISLEAAMAINEKENEVGEGPKTIKLKKPSEMATVRAPQKPDVAGTSPLSIPPAAGGTAPLEATAALEPMPEESGDQTPTKRKTIKVKKPTQRGDFAEGGYERSRPSIAVAVAPSVMEDNPHWIFGIFGAFAVIVAGLVVWVFCAQCLGPNPSLTQLSYKVDGPDLQWFDKLPPMPRQ
jgi:hypothetical protein